MRAASRGGIGPCFEIFRASEPPDQLHREEIQFLVRADLVDRHDVRMLHARGRLRLALEALDEIGRGPGPADSSFTATSRARLFCRARLDHAHATLADPLDQLVVAEA
jgi:hypothetical protein